MRAALLLGLLLLPLAAAAQPRDRDATVFRRVEPEYPEALEDGGLGGRVVVRAEVRRDGTVGEASVASADDPRLGAAALAAVRQWLFLPALRDGQPRASTVTVPIRFRTRTPVAVPLAGLPVRALPPDETRLVFGPRPAADSLLLVLRNPEGCRTMDPPDYASEGRPDYVRRGRFARADSVRARFWIRVDAEGRARAIVQDSLAASGPARLVERNVFAMRRALEEARFTPASCDGVPVDAWVTLAFTTRPPARRR